MAVIQVAFQPTDSLQIALRMFHRDGKPSHHAFLCRESIQTYHFEPRSLSCVRGWYIATQPIPGLLVLAYHTGSPFCPVGIDEPGGETPFRRLIYKPTKRSLNIVEILLGNLSCQVAVAISNNPNIAQLSSMSGPLRLSALSSTVGRTVTFTRTL